MSFEDNRAVAIRRRVVSAAREVYKTLGWGWREEVYREALAEELKPLHVTCEIVSPVYYKGKALPHVSVRWDLLVSESVLVEIKATKSKLSISAERQVVRYNSTHSFLCLALNFPDRKGAQIEFINI